MSLSRNDEDGVTGWVLLLAFIIAGFFLIMSRDNARNRVATPGFANETISPMASVLSKPVRSFENIIFGFRDRARAFEENKALRDELLALREKQARYDVLQTKVQRYEQILGQQVGTDIPLKKIAARAVSESEGPFARSMLINAGRDKGVSIGNPVLSPQGLVGHIIQTGESSARLLRLEDLNSRISVQSQSTGTRAILAGDNTDLPKLAYAENLEGWFEGDQVITSGDDGMLPQGLPVGEVIKDEGGKLRVKLLAGRSPIDWVWVSPYQPIFLGDDQALEANREEGEN